MDSGNRQSSEHLARLNRLATTARFVAGLAHELNNSLQVVSGLVELLADRPDLPPDVVLRLQKIEGQAGKASTAIRRVLGFTREVEPGPSQVDLADLADQAVALRRYALERAGISVTVEPPPAPAPVQGDLRQLLQLVVNLVLNAEEALAGQPRRLLRLAIDREGNLVRLIVEDSGPGVSPHLAERIFEPFVTTRDGDGALGLGLTVGRATAAACGGSLRLTTGDEGATFVLELPAA